MRKQDIKTFDDFMKYTIEEDPSLKTMYDTNDIIIEVIHSIVNKRRELGLSQRDLSEKTGIPQPSIARLETLRSKPSLQTLLKLMQPLGLKLTVANNQNMII